jgi:hypothetical protein
MTRRTATLGLLALALTATLTACNGSDNDTTLSQPTAEPTTEPTTAQPTASPAAATLKGQPIYWVAESRSSFRLYREFRDVPEVGGEVASAVAAMTRMAPLDPDDTTPWRPASRVTASQQGDALTVDLSRDALAGTNVGSELAATAVQQLVYTATAAAAQAGTPATTVRITVDGAAADAWGAVRLGEPTRRAALIDVQAQAWVTSPQEGATVPAGTVTFQGFGTSFEATFGWKVLSGSTVVKRGSAMGGTGDGGFGAFTFSAELEAGSYTVVLSTDDPSGGAEGHGPATDDKRFTVQ